MQSQDVIQPLTQSELNCLKAISQSGDISAFVDYGPVLHDLIELGLIEQTSQIWMPLEMKHDCFQLTSLGYEALAKVE
jgi:hypothetical protein